MLTIPRSAGGAVAYSRPDTWAIRSSSAAGFSSPDPRDDRHRRWGSLIDGLLSVRTLDDDWDGQGAVAPSPNLVDAAIRLAQFFQAAGVRPADFAIPGVNGTILFEWHDPVEYVEVEMDGPGRVVQRTTDRTSGETRTTDFV